MVHFFNIVTFSWDRNPNHACKQQLGSSSVKSIEATVQPDYQSIGQFTFVGIIHTLCYLLNSPIPLLFLTRCHHPKTFPWLGYETIWIDWSTLCPTLTLNYLKDRIPEGGERDGFSLCLLSDSSLLYFAIWIWIFCPLPPSHLIFLNRNAMRASPYVLKPTKAISRFFLLFLSRGCRHLTQVLPLQNSMKIV